MTKKMTLCEFAHLIETEHPFSFYYYNSRDQRDADGFTPLDVFIPLSEPLVIPNLQAVCLQEENGRESRAKLCVKCVTSVILSKDEMNFVSMDFFTVSPTGETRVITIEAIQN